MDDAACLLNFGAWCGIPYEADGIWVVFVALLIHSISKIVYLYYHT